jgi:PPP family 3-phenylpropionic acid transporter
MRRPVGRGRHPSLERHGDDDLDACTRGVQALHGLTFALLHMVAMRIIATSIPERLAATAQSFYGAFALGAASAALTLASGYLYGLLGIRAFWAMAGLCAVALPLVGGLTSPSSYPEAPRTE